LASFTGLRPAPFGLQAGKALVLTLATPGAELGGIQPLATQDRGDRIAFGTGVYLIEDAALVIGVETTALAFLQLRIRHDFLTESGQI
jgi:hypothetical protein